MDERDRVGKLSPEIAVYATNKHFLNLYDALRIDKVKVEIAGYDPNTNRQTGHASAWLDKDDARLLAHLVYQRLFPAVTGGTWERYGGSQREDGFVESRTITVEWDKGEDERYARFPYRITIANGPGKRTQTGAVTPAGEPTARLTMRMPEADMIKLMLTLADYVRAYETAHHHRIVAQKMRDLRDKFAERASRQAEVAAPGNGSGGRNGRNDEWTPAPAAPAATANGRPALKAIPGGNSADKAPTAARIPAIDRVRAG